MKKFFYAGNFYGSPVTPVHQSSEETLEMTLAV